MTNVELLTPEFQYLTQVLGVTEFIGDLSSPTQPEQFLVWSPRPLTPIENNLLKKMLTAIQIFKFQMVHETSVSGAYGLALGADSLEDAEIALGLDSARIGEFSVGANATRWLFTYSPAEMMPPVAPAEIQQRKKLTWEHLKALQTARGAELSP